MTTLTGTTLYPGIATGMVYIFKPYEPCIGVMPAYSDAQRRLAAYQQVQQAARQELAALAQRSSSLSVARIQQEILADEKLNVEMESAILNGEQTDAAIERVYTKFAARFAGERDPKDRQFFLHVHDVRIRLLRICEGEAEPTLAMLEEPCAVVTSLLLPSQLAGIDRVNTLALLMEAEDTSSCIGALARELQIPAICNLPGLVEQAQQNGRVLVDALRGRVTLEPSVQQLELAQQDKMYHTALQTAKPPRAATPPRPMTTADHTRVEVGLAPGNESIPADYSMADSMGPVLTDTLFARSAPPAEKAQYQFYRELAQAVEPRPVFLALWAPQPDKLPGWFYLPQTPDRQAPLSSLSLALMHPEVLRTQVRAALRASVRGRLRLVLPPANGVEQLREARELIHTVAKELQAENLMYDTGYKLGCIIDTPALAMMANLVAQELDFAYIGTDGLTRHVIGVQPILDDAAACPLFHPAVYRLIAFVAQSFSDANVPLYATGGMVADLAALPVLLGFGIRAFHVPPIAVAGVRQRLTTLTMTQARAISAKVMRAATSEDIRMLLHQHLVL